MGHDLLFYLFFVCPLESNLHIRLMLFGCNYTSIITHIAKARRRLSHRISIG